MRNTAKRSHLVGIIKHSELESELIKYHLINSQIKELEAQKERLRNSLVKSYFEHNPTYQNKDGSVIATYLPQNRKLFDSKKLGEENPEVYEQFTYQMTCHIFTVKRSAQS